MKIAFLHLTMGLSTRGSEIVIDRLASSLAKKHDVIVFHSGKNSSNKYKSHRVMPLDHPPQSAPKNIFDKILFRLQVDAESEAVINFTRAVLPRLSTFGPDIVVCVNGSLQLRLLKSSLKSSKYVAFGHAGIGHHDASTLKAKPDLFIALSQAALSWAERVGSTSTKKVYIPNPIQSTQKLKPQKLSLPKPIVLTVSALSAYKNVGSVISAIADTNFSFLLIGDGEESTIIASSLSKLPGDFKWIKHLEHEEIESIYHSCDIFCFIPDSQEAFGMVYLEAMAAGLPIIASDDPIRRELIGNQGIFVNSSDHQAIVQALKKAKTLGHLNYAKELEPYKLSTVVSRIEEEFYALNK